MPSVLVKKISLHSASLAGIGPAQQESSRHEQWIEAQGPCASSAPREVYVTDPADYPDPKIGRPISFGR
jgi:hypothetical protein